MKLNSNTKLIGRNILLIPYEAHHVPKYHTWMKSEELQQLTASEPLTLEEEYNMQASWRNDDDKCTFIILDKALFAKSKDEIEAMIGDTNIFLSKDEYNVGEIEIMIAEPSARGKKLGWEGAVIMLLYGIKFINIEKYIAKISLSNTVSVNMFKKLGFLEQSCSEVFQEVTLEKIVNSEWIDWLHQQILWQIDTYCK